MSRVLTYVLTWIALLVLLALTLGSAFIPLGPWNGVVNLAIAAAKALLIAVMFMHLRRSSALLRLAPLIALYTLALLVGLSTTDYAVRHVFAAPWSSPR